MEARRCQEVCVKRWWSGKPRGGDGRGHLEIPQGRVFQAEGEPGQGLQDRRMLGASKEQRARSFSNWHRMFRWSGRDESLIPWLFKRREKGDPADSVSGVCDS